MGYLLTCPTCYFEEDFQLKSEMKKRSRELEISLEATINRTSDLMLKLSRLEVQPAIFKIFLIASEHLSGVEAVASFRGDEVNDISARGDTILEALTRLEKVLEEFKPCPHCGQYPELGQ